MKNVNLLPQWYLDRKRQRRKLHLHLYVMVAIGLLLMGWAWADRQEILALQKQLDTLQRRTGALHDLTAELQHNQQELHRLQNLQLAARELGSTVPMSAMVQQILNNMTPGMALSRITIEVKSDPVKADGRVAADPHHPPRFHDVAHINVSGVAPDPMLIAQLIGKLTTNPLFSDVALNFSRAELLQNYDVRRFEILLNMDLDRLTGQEPRENLQAQDELPPPGLAPSLSYNGVATRLSSSKSTRRQEGTDHAG